MDLDTIIKRLQDLRAQKGNLVGIRYLVHSDCEQYLVDAVDVVAADGAIEDKYGVPEGTEYVLIKSDSVW